jgi:hypothetical protein
VTKFFGPTIGAPIVGAPVVATASSIKTGHPIGVSETKAMNKNNNKPKQTTLNTFMLDGFLMKTIEKKERAKKAAKKAATETATATTTQSLKNEIINQYSAPYNLYWSGGIDSTLLLVSFLKVLDPKSLIIHLTKNSIKENEYFFENIIKPNLKFAFATGDASNIGSNITGECGDTVWAALDHGFFLSEPIKSYIYKPWQHWFETKSNDIDFLNFAEKFMENAGRPIVTLFDARWWFYLLCKSQSKATSLQMKTSTFHNSIVIPFYESTDIETWAWYNVENIIKGNNWQTYKWPAKEIIYKFDKNKDYLKNKSKELSTDLQDANQRKLETNKPLFLTDNFQRPKLSTHPFFSNSVYKIELYEKSHFSFSRHN